MNQNIEKRNFMFNLPEEYALSFHVDVACSPQSKCIVQKLSLRLPNNGAIKELRRASKIVPEVIFMTLHK